MSDLEDHFEQQLRDAGAGEEWIREHRFHSVRRFRFDFAWLKRMFAVEIDGGTRHFGRHNRPDGFHKDCIKHNLAVKNGWRVLRFDSEMVKDGTAVSETIEALGLFPEVATDLGEAA